MVRSLIRLTPLAAALAFAASAQAQTAPFVAPPAQTLSPAPIAKTPAVPAASSPAAIPPVALVPAPAPAVTPVIGTAPIAPASPATTAAAPPIPGSVAPPGTAPAVPAATVAVAPKPAPVKKVAPPAPPRETALSSDPTPTFGPDTIYFTAKTSQRYAAIADAGGWPKVSGDLRPGAQGDAVAVLRQRLAIEGDLAVRSSNPTWDDELTRAVKHFQSRMGLKETGIVAGATLKAMNIPAATRFRQLASSAQRIAGSNFAFGDRYVVVNIPATAVEAIENGRVAHRYIAVAGDIDHRSPEITARVQSINLNPTWTVPVSIIKNEIIPHMRKDPGYLARQKIRVLTYKGEEIDPRSINWSTDKAASYMLRQDSGAGNSLGAIRINMPNKDAVYMHDTPSKRLFGADYRFLSHGCVRVEGVYELASWLLQDTSGSPTGTWDKAALLQGVATKDRMEIKLSRSVPVAWVYMTGWATPDGTAHFRDDVYGYDTIGEAQASR